jgi:hypothetical protein
MPNISNASDASPWLDQVKVTMSDGDDTYEQNAAETIVRAYLAGRVDATTMAAWNIASPSSIPLLIRQIGGQLAAAFRMRKLYSEGSVQRGVMTYGQQMYTEAMQKLNDIITGKAILYDVSSTAVIDDNHITSANYFYPNDSTVPLVPILNNPDASQNSYKFGMDSIF